MASIGLMNLRIEDLTATVTILPATTETAILTDAECTEKATGKGWYTFTVPTTETGWHRVVVKLSTVVSGGGWVNLTNASPTEDIACESLADAILNSAQSEPGQGTPAVNATPLQKLAYIFKAWRNKKTQTATEYNLYADDASTVDQQAAITDDGETTSIGEVTSGP